MRRAPSRPIIDGTARPAPFKYRHYGNFATIGRKAAIADFGGFSLKGTLAGCCGRWPTSIS